MGLGDSIRIRWNLKWFPDIVLSDKNISNFSEIQFSPCIKLLIKFTKICRLKYKKD